MSAVPKTVVALLFTLEKVTLPVPVAGATVAVKVTLVPAWTLVDEGLIVTELPVRAEEAAHAVNRAFMSTDPSPVTVL
jgi:hypothetical protein